MCPYIYVRTVSMHMCAHTYRYCEHIDVFVGYILTYPGPHRL